MVKINDIELKNIKGTRGHEGEGVTANIYMDGKKIGTLENWGDGGNTNIHIEKPFVEEFDKRHEAYVKKFMDDKEADDELFFNEMLELIRIEKRYKDAQKKANGAPLSLIAIYELEKVKGLGSWFELTATATTANGNERNYIERMKIKDSKIDKCKIFLSLKEFIINTEGKEKTFETIIYTKEKPEKVIFKGATENHDPDPLLFKELYRREKNNILGIIHNVQKGYYLQVTMHYSYSGSICNMKMIRQGKTEKNINNHISINIGMKGGKTNEELRKMTIGELDSIILPIIEPYDKRVQLENMVAVKVCCPFCDKVQYVNESKLFKKEICSCGKEIEPIFDMIEQQG
jgi:hypothetical protein